MRRACTAGGIQIALDGSAALVAGGIVIILAGLLSGATGFGFALLSTPLLLGFGFPLQFVVAAVLTLGMLTRISVALRLRRHVSPRRTLMLIGGSIPGLYLGAHVVSSVDASAMKAATGALVMVMAVYLLRSSNASPPRPIPGATLAAGLIGGFLGATTSLLGVPAALLLTRDKVAPLSFLGDLATFFVVSNIIALALLYRAGALPTAAIFPAVPLWLPGALVGNFTGVRLAGRIPIHVFRRITMGVIFISGAVSIITA